MTTKSFREVFEESFGQVFGNEPVQPGSLKWANLDEQEMQYELWKTAYEAAKFGLKFGLEAAAKIAHYRVYTENVEKEIRTLLTQLNGDSK